MTLSKHGFYYESIWLWNHFNWIYSLGIRWKLCNYFIRMLKMIKKIMVLSTLPTFSLFFINKYKWYLLCSWTMSAVTTPSPETSFWCPPLLLHEGEYSGGGPSFSMSLNEFLGISFTDITCSSRLKPILPNQSCGWNPPGRADRVYLRLQNSTRWRILYRFLIFSAKPGRVYTYMYIVFHTQCRHSGYK